MQRTVRLVTTSPVATTTDMPSPIHQLIHRKPGSKEIDVQLSLHVFAKELIAKRDEERRIRNSRRYRNAVRAVFKDRGDVPLTRAELVRGAYAKLRVKVSEATKTLDDLWNHVTINREAGYLRMAGQGMVLKQP